MVGAISSVFSQIGTYGIARLQNGVRISEISSNIRNREYTVDASMSRGGA